MGRHRASVVERTVLSPDDNTVAWRVNMVFLVKPRSPGNHGFLYQATVLSSGDNTVRSTTDVRCLPIIRS